MDFSCHLFAIQNIVFFFPLKLVTILPTIVLMPKQSCPLISENHNYDNCEHITRFQNTKSFIFSVKRSEKSESISINIIYLTCV